MAGFQDILYDHHQNDFQESFYVHSLFMRTSLQGHVLLLLYVNDMIVTGDETACIADI